MCKASLTYSITTEESAADGEHAEHGWYLPGGWEHALEDDEGRHEDVLEEAKAGAFDLPLKDALKEARDLGCREGTERSWYSVDDVVDMHTGEHRQYTVHVDKATPATYRRITRWLKGKPIFGQDRQAA